ncbi:MAG: DUF4160 domain-containing protein [Chlorobi bacterium]|nr:DUF4160 domain-containing protein [Chlorobiota bacterium]MCI0716701.1 DUF4160 domain-containing protein [Chlorobiota bacterium]
MPKLLIVRQYVFLIYSSDLAENRKHVHVESRKGRFRQTAKFWLEPKVALVDKGGFSKTELKNIEKLIKENLNLLNRQIEKFANGIKIKTIKITK